MKLPLRATIAGCTLAALALVVPTNEVSAAPRKSLDVAEFLNQGGVRLLVVDFYASWCKPCEKELPQWKRIQEEYRNQGVRIVLVRTEDPNGAQQRLPTEHEWQRAAESGQGRTFPWGEAAPSNQLCWDGDGSPAGKGNRQSTCAVGSFPKGDSAQGVKDLSGNVWEWTDSCFDADCSARVDRGGGWFDDRASFLRAAFRDGRARSFRHGGLGFRCAR